MGIKGRRKNTSISQYSTILTIPASLEKGKESTLAANRLILLDPRGEIHEKYLLEFLEDYVEPNFWPWYREKKKARKADF